MKTANPIPWLQLMAFGLGRLQLGPDQFWSMTLREIEQAMIGTGELSPQYHAPNRSDLETLMAANPDNKSKG